MIYHFPRDIAIIVSCTTAKGLLVSKSPRYVTLWFKTGNYIQFSGGKSENLFLTSESVRILGILDYYCNYSLISRIIKGERPKFLSLEEVEKICYKNLK